MALKSLCGIPGSGKTLEGTRLALKHYKKENNIIKFSVYHILSLLHIKKAREKLAYYKVFPNHKINNVYSNYPILLNKRKKIYCNQISLWDLDNNYSFYPNAIIIIDEVQLYVDSDEYKDKAQNARIKKVAKFLQAHRHFGIKDIYFISQHPSRIFKKARNICESYLKMRKLIKIPLLNIAISLSTGYYEFDFYGRFIPRSHEERKKLPFDYYKQIRIFSLKKVGSAYDSRYLSLYNFGKPLKKGIFSESKVPLETLDELFDS